MLRDASDAQDRDAVRFRRMMKSLTSCEMHIHRTASRRSTLGNFCEIGLDAIEAICDAAAVHGRITRQEFLGRVPAPRFRIAPASGSSGKATRGNLNLTRFDRQGGTGRRIVEAGKSMNRWNAKLAVALLVAAGMAGCGQKLYMTPSEAEHWQTDVGLPKHFELDPHATILPSTHNRRRRPLLTIPTGRSAT